MPKKTLFSVDSIQGSVLSEDKMYHVGDYENHTKIYFILGTSKAGKTMLLSSFGYAVSELFQGYVRRHQLLTKLYSNCIY